MKYSEEQICRAMQLYVITDRTWLKPGQRLTHVVKQVLEQGATFLQVREKDLKPDEFLQEARALKEICEAHQVPFVVNDSIKIALQCQADGVHVGQSDLKGRDLRALLGPDKLLGISAGTVAEALAAQQAGANYIGVGAIFGTSTKKNARNMTMARLQEICQAVSIPVVAIGGINADNIAQLKGGGVDGVAVISAIFAAEDPAQATKQLHQLSKELVHKDG